MLPLVILAAGKSRRFGSSDKRFTMLPHGGVLINALVRRARKAGLDVSVVIGVNDDVADNIDAPCIIAPNASRGMGATIADVAAIFSKQLAAESLLIMPADLPLLRIESLRRVAAKATLNRIVVPECGGRRGHPVAFGKQFWPLLSGLSGDEGARALITSHPDSVDIVQLQDEGIYRDADTPAEMRALLQKLHIALR